MKAGGTILASLKAAANRSGNAILYNEEHHINHVLKTLHAEYFISLNQAREPAIAKMIREAFGRGYKPDDDEIARDYRKSMSMIKPSYRSVATHDPEEHKFAPNIEKFVSTTEKIKANDPGFKKMQIGNLT